MLLSSSRLLSFISLPALITALQYSAIEKGAYETDSILRRDVVIIGGGNQINHLNQLNIPIWALLKDIKCFSWISSGARS